MLLIRSFGQHNNEEIVLITNPALPLPSHEYY